MAQSSLHAKGLESSCWHFQGPLNLGSNILLNMRMLLLNTSISVCGDEPTSGERVVLYATRKILLAFHLFLQINVLQPYPGPRELMKTSLFISQKRPLKSEQGSPMQRIRN